MKAKKTTGFHECVNDSELYSMFTLYVKNSLLYCVFTVIWTIAVPRIMNDTFLYSVFTLGMDDSKFYWMFTEGKI